MVEILSYYESVLVWCNFLSKKIIIPLLARKSLGTPENLISSRAPWSPVFQTLKNSNFNALKNSKKYLDVANCIHYDHENFQNEIPCYVGLG
jgi:hypothetical protein